MQIFAITILLLSCLAANALVMRQSDPPRQTAQGPHLRNALTDVSLTQIHSQYAQAPQYIRINLADDPGGSSELHRSSYHGKHVTGIIFLSLAGIFGITGAILAGKNDGEPLTIMGAILCGLAFIGFVIPGAILLARYPRNRPRTKENE